MYKYTQDRNQSCEIFRLVLAKMSQHPASFTPFCYAVWYEYLANINPDLIAKINQLIASNTPIDDNQIDDLFSSHISHFEEDAEKILHTSVKEILEKVLESTNITHNATLDYAKELSKSEKDITNATENTIKSIIQNLKVHTSQVSSKVNHLATELEQSQKEVFNLQKELEKARVESLIDPLTGLLNRRGFSFELSKIITKDINASIIILDIDHFKKINDTYGHLTGDNAIRSIAETIKTKIHNSAIAARIGGEEFAILLPNTPANTAGTVAERLRIFIKEKTIKKYGDDSKDISFTSSFGVTQLIKNEDELSFINRADNALYSSKETGRDKVTII